MNGPERHLRVVPDGPDAEIPPIFTNLHLLQPVIYEELIKHKEFHSDISRPDYEYHSDLQGHRPSIFAKPMLAYWTPDTYQPPEGVMRVGQNRQIVAAIDRLYEINAQDISHLSVSGLRLAVSTRRKQNQAAAQSVATQFL